MGLFTETVEKTPKTTLEYLITCIVLMVMFIALSIFILCITPDYMHFLVIPLSIMAGGFFVRAIDTYNELKEGSTPTNLTNQNSNQ